MKCPICQVSNVSEALTCSQCGSDLAVHKTLNRLRELAMSKSPDLTQPAQAPLQRDSKLILWSLVTISSVSLVGFALLSYFLQSTLNHMNQLTQKMDAIQTQVFQKIENTEEEKEQHKALQAQTIHSLAMSLQLTSESLQQEIKLQKKEENTEKLATTHRPDTLRK